ncbi:MAG: hypothetical protein FWH42_03120 [Dehalococcoidia bacterium]|nr:hypothetical protein [Dehalococcoidia bacterium]
MFWPKNTSHLSRPRLYRGLVAVGLLLSFLLALFMPQHIKEGRDWSVQYAVQNIASGNLTIDSDTFDKQNQEAIDNGGSLDWYQRIDTQRWGYIDAPGYVFFLLPFHFLHASFLGNCLLAIGMTIVIYLLLKQLKGELVACLGALLWLVSPVALAMFQRTYADTFAIASFIGIGGGLYIYYLLRREELGSKAKAVLLALAGLGIGWGVWASYANVWIAGLFISHFIYLQIRLRLIGRRSEVAWTPLWFFLGLFIPLTGLLLYQKAVFGSVFSYGFQYNTLPVSFNTIFIGQNIKQGLVAWLVGFPLLIPGLAALVWELRFNANPSQKYFSNEVLLLLGGWVTAVFVLYLTYEWTARADLFGMPFIIPARYVLPGLLPLLLLSVVWLDKISSKALVYISIPLLLWGVVFFAQSAVSYPEVPVNPQNPWRSNTESIPTLSMSGLSQCINWEGNTDV